MTQPFLRLVTSENATIAARIRARRLARGLTQAELAQAIGVSRSAVAQWETGRAGQVRANLARIGAALGVAAAYLLEGIEPVAAENATELALLRLYRECREADRALLLTTARRLAAAAASPAQTQ